MSRTRLWLTAILVLFALPTGAQTSADVVTQADALFAELWGTQYTLTDAAELQARLEAVMDLYAQVLVGDPSHLHALNMLARCHYMLADLFLPERDKVAGHARGQEYGERALRASSEFVRMERERGFVEAARVSSDVPALFWTYSNWARKIDLGGAVGLIGAVLRGDDKKLMALIERCLELDRTYISGGPLRALAAYWAKHPLSKDPVKVKELLEEAIASFPDYLENRLFYVEHYLMPAGLWIEARAHLQTIIDAPLGEDALENGHVKILALGLLTTVESKLP